MVEKYKQFEYQLSADRRYYRNVRTLDTSSSSVNYYHYKHNFTDEQVHDFICNDNLDFTFISSPYVGSIQRGFVKSIFNAE